MTHWMCTNCGYYVRAASPPNQCPTCKQWCSFSNVTCYRPDCGGEGNIDLLVAYGTRKATAGAPSQATSKQVSVMEVLPPVYVLGNLTEEQGLKVRSLGHTKTYEMNTIICRQGSEAHELYLVEEGRVAARMELPNGAHVPITIVNSSGAFGWSALVRPYQFTATVMALSRTRVLAIQRDALLAHMRANPRIGFLIMQDIASVIASQLRNLELEMSACPREPASPGIRAM